MTAARPHSVEPAAPGFVPYLLLYAVSGYAFLAVEYAWIRSLIPVMGSTLLSMSLVISILLLFLAAGNILGGRLAERIPDPLRGYGWAECGMGLSAWLLYMLKDRMLWVLADDGVEVFSFEGVLLRGLFTVCLLGLPSLFAGMTYAMLAQRFVRNCSERTRHGAWLYAANLGGSALGILLGGVYIPSWLGFHHALQVACGMSLATGCAAIWLATRSRMNALESPPVAAKAPPESADAWPAWVGVAILFLTGFIGLSLELLVMAYARFFGFDSIYGTATVLLIFLLGLAAGGLLSALLRRRYNLGARGIAACMWLAGLLVLLHPPAIHWGLVKAAASETLIFSGPFSFFLFVRTLALVAPMAVLAGWIFTLGWDFIRGGGWGEGRTMGRIMAINKLGSAVGVFVMPFLGIPALGLPGSVLACAVLCMLCGGLIEWNGRAAARVAWKGFVVRGAVASVAVVLWLRAEAPYIVRPGEELVDVVQGRGSLVAVVDVPAQASRRIVLDNIYALNGTGQAMQSQRHQAWIPLFLHPRPDRVVHIGMASGITSAAVLDYPVRSFTAVEVVPEVVEVARRYFAEFNRVVFEDPRSRVLVNDGRHVLRSMREPVDLVICDLMFPGQDAASFLYSLDFFRLVMSRLDEGGVFFLWLPAYQMDNLLSGMVMRTFNEVFPHAILVRGTFDPTQPIVGLAGSGRPFDLSEDGLHRRVEAFAACGLNERSPFFRSARHALLMLMGDVRSAAHLFESYPLTSDRHPVFAFKAPKHMRNTLTGLTLLNLFGYHLYSDEYPSCLIEGSEEWLRPAIRAGNYYYAAASADRGGERAYSRGQVQEAMNFFGQTLSQINRAWQIYPEAPLGREDL